MLDNACNDKMRSECFGAYLNHLTSVQQEQLFHPH